MLFIFIASDIYRNNTQRKQCCFFPSTIANVRQQYTKNAVLFFHFNNRKRTATIHEECSVVFSLQQSQMYRNNTQRKQCCFFTSTIANAKKSLSYTYSACHINYLSRLKSVDLNYISSLNTWLFCVVILTGIIPPCK
jgi:hypothetical protein